MIPHRRSSLDRSRDLHKRIIGLYIRGLSGTAISQELEYSLSGVYYHLQGRCICEEPTADKVERQKRRMTDGCEVAPRCVQCPLVICKHDVSGQASTVRLYQRVVELRRMGKSLPEISHLTGTAKETINHALMAVQPVVERLKVNV